MRTVVSQVPSARPTCEARIRSTLRLRFGQAEAAQLLLTYGADLSLLDAENDAIPLGWAAFFGRPAVVAALLEAGSEPSQRNKHGLTPLACAVGGTQGRWHQFSNATVEEWQSCADLIRSQGGTE